MKRSTVILGAGAAGMMCATEAGPDVLVIDHARAPGEKIRISGGGRCNFTNMNTSPDQFLSQNPHFCKSALARYTQWDFIDLVGRHGIAWHEKTLGQLFCDGSAKQIVAMLQSEMRKAGAELWLDTQVGRITALPDGFKVSVSRQGASVDITCRHLVLATGGKSIPKMGATGLAYDIAAQFGLPVTDTHPALVPLTFSDNQFKPLAGVSVPARLSNSRASFDEAMLFTHRGLSGPAILQLSSYWRAGEEISVNLDPEDQLVSRLRAQRQTEGRRLVKTELAHHLPGRLVEFLSNGLSIEGRLADTSDRDLDRLMAELTDWRLRPTGSEGYRTAEVTLGGIDTDGLSSRTMEAKSVPGLFAIGEAVDVTGWLGGYNFQWAWSSAVAAGREIASRV